jgi:pimeloyl-ACP methyl ester carboxylesterase
MKRFKLILLSLLAFIVLAAVTLYIVFLVKNQETKVLDADARKNVPGQFIQLTDGITHYETGGADTGKTIILVHGFSVPYYIWGGTYDSLVQQGFHVIRYDEFGRGYSDRPAAVYEPSFYRKQLFDLIHSLKLKMPVNLAGVSFGGAVVTDFAIHYPSMIDKIILIDPVYHFREAGPSEAIVNYVMAVQHEKQANGQIDDLKYPEHFPDWVSRYKVQMQYKGFRHALISTIMHYPGDTIIANYHALDSLHKKVLLIWGKEDQTVPYNFSDSLQQILHADFFPVADARHLPYLEKPLIVNPKIISFLK